MKKKKLKKKSSKSKAKLPNVDGLGPKNIKALRTAIRRVWGWSYARKLCLARAVGPDGFSVCEKCKLKVPKVFADHIEPCGDVDEGYIRRTFVPSNKLQALCKKCHDKKTKEEKAVSKEDDMQF